jgi:hypothetical protein
VYKTGFATTQEDYEAVVVPLFNSLDRLEKMLTGKDYLVGDTLTEADVRLWVTIVGFVINDQVLIIADMRNRFVSILSISATSSATSVPFETVTPLSTRASFHFYKHGFDAYHTYAVTVG